MSLQDIQPKEEPIATVDNNQVIKQKIDDPSKLYDKYQKSVLLVFTYNKSNEFIGAGTAFAIDNQGRFVTAAHVIKDATSIRLFNTNKTSFEVEKVEYIDPLYDLAVIKINENEFTPLPLASYDTAKVGSRVFVISYPKGNVFANLDSYEPTFSQGDVSAIREKQLNLQEEVSLENSLTPSYSEDRYSIYSGLQFVNNLSDSCSYFSDHNFNGDFYSSYLCSDKHWILVGTQKKNPLSHIVINDGMDRAELKDCKIYYYLNTNKVKTIMKRTIFRGKMIQLTASVSPGSSGGPIFNEYGEVVGVVNSLIQDSQNTNFGRPVNYLPSLYLSGIEIPSFSDPSPEKISTQELTIVDAFKEFLDQTKQGKGKDLLGQLKSEVYSNCSSDNFKAIKSSPSDLFEWVNVDDSLNMRNDPSTDWGSVIASIPRGSKVQVILVEPETKNVNGKEGHWSLISWKGKRGWVLDSYLSAQQVN